jgi:hypothetical protein
MKGACMLSKIVASAVFIGPIFLIMIFVFMSFGYKGSWLYVIGALVGCALFLWPVVNIFRGTMNPWSTITWVVAAVDVLLLFLTFVPRKSL